MNRRFILVAVALIPISSTVLGAPPSRYVTPDRQLLGLLPFVERSDYSPRELSDLFALPLDQALEAAILRAAADPPCAEIPSLEGPAVADSVDALHYDIVLEHLDEATLTARFTTTVTLQALRDLAQLELHLAGMAIESVGFTLDWRDFTPVAFQHEGDMLRIQPPTPVPQGAWAGIRVTYTGAPSCISRYGIPAGIQFSRIGVHTFSEPSYARHWFPCHDVPRDKATATLTLTLPPGREASATGRLQDDTTTDGTRRMTWRMDYPVATYLLAFSMGDYVVLRDRAPSGVALEHHVLRDQVDAARIDFQRLPVMMELFENLFGPYPFDDYRQSVGWFGGGMEHQGNSLIGTFYLRGNASFEGLFAHELAHQWWGDLVTPQAWNDIWLNEGFASYAEHLYNEHLNGWDAMRARIAFVDSIYFNNDRIVDHPLNAPETDRIFSFIVYNKGARVLDMLRGVARLREMRGPPRDPRDWDDARARGDARFFAIFPDYGSRHAYGNARSGDFQRVAEDHLGESLDWFFTRWRDQGGYPVLAYDWVSQTRPWESQLTVRLEQEPTQGSWFAMPFQVRYHAADGRVLDEVRHLGGQSLTQWTVTLPPGEWSVELDPDDLLLEQHERGSLFSRLSSLRAAPNPSPGVFRFQGVLEGEVPENSHLSVYTVEGRRVVGRELGPVTPGPFSLEWDGRSDMGVPVAPGVYLARVRVGLNGSTQKLVVVPVSQ